MSDEDATMMLATCPQQVVRVGLVEFGERHDIRTNGQHYTAADRRPTNQVSARGKLNGKVSHPTSSSPYSILARMSGMSARMLYE